MICKLLREGMTTDQPTPIQFGLDQRRPRPHSIGVTNSKAVPKQQRTFFLLSSYYIFGPQYTVEDTPSDGAGRGALVPARGIVNYCPGRDSDRTCILSQYIFKTLFFSAMPLNRMQHPCLYTIMLSLF